MPIFNAGEPIIQAYLDGVRVRQQGEANRAAKEQRQQQLDQEFKLNQDRLKQAQDEFNATMKLRTSQFGLDKLKAGQELQNHYLTMGKEGVDLAPPGGAIAVPELGEGQQIQVPQYSQVRAGMEANNTMHTQQAAQQAGAVTTATMNAQQPALELAHQRDLEKLGQQGQQQLAIADINQKGQTARNEADNVARAEEGKKNRSNAAAIAGAQIAARKEIAGSQIASKADDFIDALEDGTYNTEEFKGVVTSAKQRDAIIGTALKNGIKPITKTQSADLRGIAQLQALQQRQIKLDQAIRNGGNISEIMQGMDALQADAGQLARSLGAEKGSLAVKDIERQTKRLISLTNAAVGKLSGGKFDKNAEAIKNMDEIIKKTTKTVLGNFQPEQAHRLAEKFGIDLGAKEVK